MGALTDGAEATVTAEDYLGIPSVRKFRLPKAYRPEQFDLRLRGERLRTEARMMREARRIGVRTPLVLDIDEGSHSLVLERIEGRTLTEMFYEEKTPLSELRAVVSRLGETLGRLHAGGLSHGDLTGSNALWTGEEIAFIDMSMGSRTPELEDFGIDLHLVEEDLSTLTDQAEALYQAFLGGYHQGAGKDAERRIRRAREIKGRIRYS
ncbi:MAG: Kae1-associated serine/threonine protein kinase [Candidatus Thermoplasmatota archaeon]|jgi:Kae1-associated kinase Bud32|nr:Kae1-associated serine/threonine protein kinase [Candidatus Thermoplasmatota archaeon]